MVSLRPMPLPFREIFTRLEARVPMEVWWPGESDFEIMVGAILTQNTAWTNVEYALANLKSENLMDPQALLDCSTEQLVELIRPAGYFNAKAKYLKNLCTWVLANPNAADLPTPELRKSLLSVAGVGPETADDLLLYVYQRPVFIFDTYARRMLEAAGYDVPKSYEGARQALQHHADLAGFDTAQQAKLHGLIVDGGKRARTEGWQDLLAPLP
ncbi:hypothetical protein BSR29_05255 [Boudabousia liubingyangii]|uniref:HhH-GPD domain-containing protein n=2 Tax=Boudabousia liubingyangii TaxID=1921764 RepID=A0A1Q5PLH3_9ACTO|nr:hypothetical protein BSR29_05255 [Boudabousia liubingyangii]